MVVGVLWGLQPHNNNNKKNPINATTFKLDGCLRTTFAVSPSFPSKLQKCKKTS